MSENAILWLLAAAVRALAWLLEGATMRDEHPRPQLYVIEGGRGR